MPYDDVISSEVANHVLYHANRGGYRPGDFTAGLLAIWEVADSINSSRLAVAFPEYAAARAFIRHGEAGIEELKTIAAPTT